MLIKHRSQNFAATGKHLQGLTTNDTTTLRKKLSKAPKNSLNAQHVHKAQAQSGYAVCTHTVRRWCRSYELTAHVNQV